METGFLTFILTILIILGIIQIIRVIGKNKKTPEENLNNKASKKLELSVGLNYYNSNTCEWLDDILIDGIKNGIKQCNDDDPHYGIVVFNDDVTYQFWNANKYFGWLMQGDFKYYDEEKNEDVHLTYKKEQPSPYVMYRFKLELDKYKKDALGMGSPNVNVSRIKREI